MKGEPAALARRLLDHAAASSIWVLGDLMLDEYVEGEIDRVSPEAPVQVVEVRSVFSRLGGAANVANSCAALGARVALAGLVGDDDEGRECLAQCATAGIDTAAVVSVPGRPTTRKLRVLSRHQQLLRLDWEQRAEAPDEAANRLIERLFAAPAPDAIVVSDYAKGAVCDATLRPLLRWAKENRIPVLVDPKLDGFAGYRGATVLTPNLRELEAASGRRFSGPADPELEPAAQALLATVAVDALLVTLGELGVKLIPVSGDAVDIPAHGRDVYDITGAGDTVIALLALGLAAGLSLAAAARLANAAAGVAVSKVGTATVRPSELLEAVQPRTGGKLLTREVLAEKLAEWRRQGKQVVFTNGCFDLVHRGHVELLSQAAAMGDLLLVGLNDDAGVARLKGDDRPIVAQEERAALLAAFGCVTAVVPFSEDTPLELIETVRPDVLVKGADYRLDQVVGRDFVESYGGRVALIDLVPDHSTGALVERLRSGT